MKSKIVLIFLLSLLMMMQISGEQRPHEHGVAEANLIMEETTLELMIRMPGADFIGFEHAAGNEREKTMLRQRIESLEEMGEQLITFRTRRGMEVLLEQVHIGLVDGHDDHGHDEHGHDEHGHDKHERDEHGHDEHEGHNDYEIRLTYEVQDFERIRHLGFEFFFREFPSLEKIRWVSISHKGQNAGTLTASDNHLNPNP